ncbi:MAG TPA: FHA domain-containing protein, partial [Kofleriaceae bacterium]
MLRVEVSEEGQGALPAVDVDDKVVVIGSATNARVRLPAQAVEREHVRIEKGRWRALAAVNVDGAARDGGEIGDGVTLEVGGYRVRIAPAPAGAEPAPVQRTESLARELIRNLLGSGAQPSLEVERGPHAGAKRQLAPPESKLVIGRGDEASWIIDDKDLSRAHAEIRRGWDGTRIVDLDSKNGTKVDGDQVTGDGMALRDGCVVELGPVVLRFRDPAEKHLQGDAPAFRPVMAVEAKRAAEAQRAAKRDARR